MSHAEQREIIRVKKNPPLPVVAWEKFAFFLIVLAVLCAALVGTYIYNATRSPAYEVAVEMGVNPQRTNDQGAVAPFPYYQNKALLQDHREGLLSSEVLARVVSRPELLSIVEKEQLTPDLWKPTLSFGGTVAYLLGAEAPVFDAHAVPQTALTERILRGSAVSFDPRSQLITLRVTDYNPRFAWFVATNVTEVYREFLKNKMDTTSKPPAVASKTASILSDPTGEASVPELG
ncbi:MAG TPA: hypothetical protein VJC18_07935, partial [bacterium]|nr:hypothetical protein [bacterium]